MALVIKSKCNLSNYMFIEDVRYSSIKIDFVGGNMDKKNLRLNEECLVWYTRARNSIKKYIRDAYRNKKSLKEHENEKRIYI